MDPPHLLIQSRAVAEKRAGHHQHQAIYLSGIKVLLLRDEGTYPSVTARANAVVNNLRKVFLLTEGTFKPNHVAGSDLVMFSSRKLKLNMLILTVSKQDANAYERRSGHRITTNLLAAYWSDLLSDYWSLTLNHRSPTRLVKLHEGEALLKLYSGSNNSVHRGDTANITTAYQALTNQQREHLLHLAETVPKDFKPSAEFTGELR